MSSRYRCPADRLSTKSMLQAPQRPTTKDTTVIHSIEPDTYIRHQGMETARILERYERRRAAASRKRRGPRTPATASA